MRNCFRAGRVVCVPLLFGVLFFFAPGRAMALQSVSCGWDPSSAPDVVNYNIYYWQSGGAVTNKLAVGDVTAADVPGLVEGATYYFLITAITTAGTESAPSDQIMYTVPSPVTLQAQFVQLGNGAAVLSITATGDIPAQWTLECSPDLLTWADYATGTNMAVNIQIQDTTATQKFFRLKSL
jgi:hypothetical protein